MSDLVVTGLSKSYGSVSALRGISLSMAAGEFFVVLGPSAAGKTTLLRSIAGLERPDAGRIVFAGQDLTDRPVRGRDMAMIFQTFALYPHLTIDENLAYPLREAGVAGDEIRRRVGEIAELLRIGHVLPRRPATLSGGEQQRVAIGRALIRRPKLLLLDEPLTNLDAKLRHDTRAEFKRLHRELGMTMLYATPDQLEALTMGERIATLRAGEFVQTGTPRDLYAAPADRFVATLVGAPAMNLLPATLQHGAGGMVARLPFADLPLGERPTARAFPPGAELLVGIRPHDLKLAGGDHHRGPRIRGHVRLTEPLGDVTVIDIGIDQAVLKMVLPEELALAYEVGGDIDIEVPLAETHLFLRATGVAIR
jgi:multiple sugar transport system ATP-binding protein